VPSDALQPADPVTTQAVQSHVDEANLVALASGMVPFASQIPNEGQLAEFLSGEMRKLGCFDEVILQPVVAGRCNVIGVVRGSGTGKNMLLNGHLDIPHPYGTWSRDPYQPAVEDGWLYGLGLGDMKAAVACQIIAAAAVARSGVARAGDLVVSAVVHHDVCGLGTKFFLSSWDEPIHAAINGEPSDLKLQVAHGGAWQFEITVRGRAAHISRSEDGVNAISKMMTILRSLDASRLTYDPAQAVPGLPRLVVGEVQGGSSPSRTAERCTARGDIRIVPRMTPASLKADLERLIADLRTLDPELVAEVRGLVYQRPFRIDADATIVQLVRWAHETVTGRDAVITDGLPVSSYVTDSSDLLRAGIPTVVYGPSDWQTVPDERVRVDDLVTAARVYALAAARFIGG